MYIPKFIQNTPLILELLAAIIFVSAGKSKLISVMECPVVATSLYTKQNTPLILELLAMLAIPLRGRAD